MTADGRPKLGEDSAIVGFVVRRPINGREDIEIAVCAHHNERIGGPEASAGHEGIQSAARCGRRNRDSAQSACCHDGAETWFCPAGRGFATAPEREPAGRQPRASSNPEPGQLLWKQSVGSRHRGGGGGPFAGPKLQLRANEWRPAVARRRSVGPSQTRGRRSSPGPFHRSDHARFLEEPYRNPSATRPKSERDSTQLEPASRPNSNRESPQLEPATRPSAGRRRGPRAGPGGSPSLCYRPKPSNVSLLPPLAATLRVVDLPFRQTVRLLFGSGR